MKSDVNTFFTIYKNNPSGIVDIQYIYNYQRAFLQNPNFLINNLKAQDQFPQKYSELFKKLSLSLSKTN